MAYSVYAYIKGTALGTNAVEGWLANALDENPWWREIDEDGNIFVWIKPRLDSHPDRIKDLKLFLESMRTLKRMGYLVQITDDTLANPGDRNRLKPLIVEYELTRYYEFSAPEMEEKQDRNAPSIPF